MGETLLGFAMGFVAGASAAAAAVLVLVLKTR